MKKVMHDFTQGPVLGPLMRFALPVLLAIFLQTMYGAVDVMIVGQFGTAADVSAVTTGTSIMQTITTIIVSLSMGTTILLGRRLGEGRRDEAGRVIGASMALFALLGAVVVVAMQPLAGPMAGVMQAPAEAFGGTVTYVRICSAGALFIVAYNVLGSIFRGLGDSVMPLISVAIACALNIAGDLMLVGWLHMGVAGAALATVLAQAISVLVSLVIIRKRGLPFTFTRACIRLDREIMGEVVRLGAPIALQDLLVSISFLAITAIVNTLGVVASAGVGVAGKICGFIMLVPSAYMQAMSAFVAQNMGARKPERAHRALWMSIGTSLAVGLVMAWASFFHGDVMSGWFAGDNADVIAAAADYLKAYSIDCLLVSFLFCFVGYFNGCGATRFVMAQGIVGAFGVRVPVSMLMSRLKPMSLFMVGLATPCSTVVQIAMCAVCYLRIRRAERSALA